MKLYEVSCDYCGTCLNHYIGRKPSMMELWEDGFVATRTRVFCNWRCMDAWEHDVRERRYLNLRQGGKIHNNG